MNQTFSSGMCDETLCDDLEFVRELKALDSLLHKTQEKMIGQWMGTTLQEQIKERATEHKHQLEKVTEKNEVLHSDLAKLTENKENTIQRENRVSGEQDLANTELNKLHEERDRLLLDKEQSEKQITILHTQIVKAKQAIENTNEATSQGETSKKEVELYQKRFGMQFKKISGDRIQVVFTCIDSKDPSRPFCFCVKIQLDRTYVVSDCAPEVPNYDELVETLNKTNNFKVFLIMMRREFQSLVSNNV